MNDLCSTNERSDIVNQKGRRLCMENRGKLPSKCPGCGAKISWISGCSDSTKAGWNCTKCNAFSFAEHEHPEISGGIKMSSDFDDVGAMDKSITHLPCNVQIGILRGRHQRRVLEYEGLDE